MNAAYPNSIHSMASSSRKIVPALHAAILTMTGSAIAGAPAETAITTPPPSSGWEYRIEPYAWLMGVDGTTGVGRLTTDVDETFLDLADHIDMAAALQFEARHGRWGIIADGFFSKLGLSGSPPGPLYDDIKVGYKEFRGEREVACRVVEDPRCFVDVYAGFRYTGMSVDLHAPPSAGGMADFIEKTGNCIREDVIAGADAIVEPKLDDYKAAAAAARTVIENDVTTAVESEPNSR